MILRIFVKKGVEHHRFATEIYQSFPRLDGDFYKGATTFNDKLCVEVGIDGSLTWQQEEWLRRHKNKIDDRRVYPD